MSENLSRVVAGIYFAAFLVDHVKLQKGMGGRTLMKKLTDV